MKKTIFLLFCIAATNAYSVPNEDADLEYLEVESANGIWRLVTSVEANGKVANRRCQRYFGESWSIADVNLLQVDLDSIVDSEIGNYLEESEQKFFWTSSIFSSDSLKTILNPFEVVSSAQSEGLHLLCYAME